jgi:purine nucleoside phosphorylase
VAFRHIGAKAVIFTFHSGGFTETGPSIVSDLNTLFHSPTEILPPGIVQTFPTTTFPQSILAPYHGPEFPSPFETDLLRRTGANQITLGTANGLLIAHGLGLQSFGVADGAISLPFRSQDTLASVLEHCAAASPAVSQIISSLVAGLAATPVRPFVAGTGGRALFWNALPPLSPNEQEDESIVSRLAAALPPSDGIIFTPDTPALLSLAAGTRPLVIAGHSVHEAVISGRPVLLAASCNFLIRAAARCKMPIVFLSAATETVCVSDHADVAGLSPLCGRNLSGSRFPSLERLYRRLPMVPTTAVFRSRYPPTPAALSVARCFGAGVISDFGPPQAIVARHAGAATVAHICVRTISLDAVPLAAFTHPSS